jgi:hypothetical protein
MARMYRQQELHNNDNWRTQQGALPARGSWNLGRSNFAWFVALGLVTVACSGNSGGTGPSGGTTGGASAGASSTGGSGPAAGGTSANSTSAPTGGQTGAQGGSSAAGGTSSTSAVGGASTGGTSASASATGGAATGGAATTAAGGSATGGKSSTSTGGKATGGATATTGGATATTGGATAATGGATAATGGATSATGGSTSSCAAASITKVSDSDYQLKVCNVTVDVNPTVGARVTKLTIKPTGSSTATDVIKPYTCTGAYDKNASCNSAGSTFWTSPQSAWDGDPAGSNNWPPVADIDGGNYVVTDSGSTSGHLVLTGSNSSTEGTTLGAKVTKDFSADSSTGWITIKYTITATKAIKAAPWQITRVARGGLVFFPCSAATIKNSTPTWTVTQAGGYDWIDDKTQATSVISGDGSKIIVDAAAVSGQTYSYLGYALNSNLLLIKFPDVPSASFAPNEADMEVYPGDGFMELEPQGVYTTLAANATLSWTVQVRVAPIDSSVTVAANSATLIAFAEGQAAL